MQRPELMETKPCLTGTRSWQRGAISACGSTITIYLLRYFGPAPSWQSAGKSLSKQNLKVILPPSLSNGKVALKKNKKKQPSFALELLSACIHRGVQRIRMVPHFLSTKVLKCPQKPLHLSTSLPICVLSIYWQNMTENTTLHSIFFFFDPCAQTTGAHRRARPPPAPAGRSCHDRAESSASLTRLNLSHSLLIGLKIS